MNKIPDAWDDEWSNTADTSQSQQSQETEPKKSSTRQTKAQKRAAQAEFNRQLWAEAQGPRETNYFLESRNVVPHRQEFKAAPTLLSRKGPIIQKSRSNLEGGVNALNLNDKQESSEDEEDPATKQKTVEETKAQAAKEREEKQRKYEERRRELFGNSGSTGNSSNGYNGRPKSTSGGSSPANLTPPGSRSSTPSRGRRGRGRGNFTGQNSPHTHQQQLKEVYDPAYSAKPGSTYLMRRQQGYESPNKEIQPIREPKAPDGSGPSGAGFVNRRAPVPDEPSETVQTYHS